MVLSLKLIELVFLVLVFLGSLMVKKGLSISLFSCSSLGILFLNFEYLSISSSWFCDLFGAQMVILTVWLLISIAIFIEGASVKLLILNFLGLVSVCFFLSKTVFLLFVFFELSIFPILILILGWGIQPERVQAGFFLFLYTIFCGSPFLLSISFLESLGENNMWFFLIKNCELHSWFSSSIFCFCFFIGFLSKIPIFLVHVWLPKAHVEAPLEGSVILAGVLLKLGVFGVVRMISLFSFNSTIALLMGVAGIGMLLSALVAFSSDDMKMTVAYASISHMNVLILSLFSQKSTAKIGSMITSFSHGLASSFLFFTVYMVYNLSHSRSMIFNKGFSGVYLILFLCFFISWAVNLSIPLSFGFWGEIFCFFSILSFLPETVFLLFVFFIVSSFYSMFSFGVSSHSEIPFSIKGLTGSVQDLFVSVFYCFPLIFYFLNFCV